jgi:hypothetical protein
MNPVVLLLLLVGVCRGDEVLAVANNGRTCETKCVQEDSETHRVSCLTRDDEMQSCDHPPFRLVSSACDHPGRDGQRVRLSGFQYCCDYGELKKSAVTDEDGSDVYYCVEARLLKQMNTDISDSPEPGYTE